MPSPQNIERKQIAVRLPEETYRIIALYALFSDQSIQNLLEPVITDFARSQTQTAIEGLTKIIEDISTNKDLS